jgi:hypothetical protein
MNPSIAGMARKLKMPIVLYRIEGGYGSQPRWSDGIRKGSMHCYVYDVIQPEEYEKLTNEELFQRIEKGLYVDEGVADGPFRSRKKAEFLERVMYVCPWCGISEFETHNDIILCKKCGRQIRHLPTKELEGVNCTFPHRFVADWYDWQSQYINSTDTSLLTDAPLYTETVQLRRVIPCSHKQLLRKDATLCLYGDKITIDDQIFPLAELGAITLLGKNKLNVYTGNEILQLKGCKRFNGLKYVHFYHRHQNIRTGGQHDKFLGL